MLTILIYLCLALVAASLAVMLLFGARNSAFRLAGQSKLALAAFVLPAVLLLVFWAINQGHPEGAWTMAAIWTALITSVLALVALVVSGVRGLAS